MKTALYGRVSTDRQESFNQIAELRTLCDRKGWEIVAEYLDEDISGKQPRRPQLEALMRDAHHGDFNLVCFWSLDRLTRLGADDACDVLARIAATGADFVSYREEGLNSMGPWKRVMIDMLAIVANFEAQRISDRTKAGLARARAEGRRLGRPPRDFNGLTAASIGALRAQGLSWSHIEQKTGIPATSVRRLAKTVSPENG